jgi:CheY-like chemotaxis protein/anti-sigma regulatory factor (Ser/Thr protein kinase)
LAVRARDVVRRQLGNLRRLVDDLLDVARVTTGKIALQSSPLELTAVVRRSIAALKDARRLADHEVQLALDQAWVCADDTRLEQIVCNLVENAAKYAPPGGNIRVSVRREDANAVLEVSDTGRGISADLLPRVFDLFTQDERTLDRSQGGLGLGLSLVRRLVELHHGTVTAASEGPGKGATFVVRLPQIEAPVFVAAPTQSAPARTKRRRILVIEDNVDGRDALKELLQGQGHEVHTAGDGPAGVEEALAVSPEVVLIDIGLPGFDGYEVARRLRASTQGKHLKLIALTGYGQEEDVKRARDVGFDDYLVKPVEMNVLERVCAAA